MKPTNVMYDSSSDFRPARPGIYPAHMLSLDTNEWNGSTVYNMQFKIADDVKNMDSSGENLGHIAGRKFFSKGVWFTPSPKKGESWKNKTYKNFFTNLGVEFEEVDSSGTVRLDIVEADDVVGHCCFVKIDERTYTTKAGEQKTKMEVVDVLPWEEGKNLSPDEIAEDDLPF
jgi:hypothetical protein